LQIQHIALYESRTGIPLLVASDSIHGFGTVYPHPFNLSCSWDTSLVKDAAALSAMFGSYNNIHLAFIPMASITRDPRWTGTMKGFGEDPMLASLLSKAVVYGMQGKGIENEESMAACATNYVGPGNSFGEGNFRHDWIPRVELRNFYLPPFKALTEVGISAIMVSNGAINAIPIGTNKCLLKKILEEEWGFNGIVMSGSMRSLVNNISTNFENVTISSIHAGIDMEVQSNFHQNNLAKLLNEGKIKQVVIDNALRDILRIKSRMKLENRVNRDTSGDERQWPQAFYNLSKKLSDQSTVLLKNNNNLLPLSRTINSISIYGATANEKQIINNPFGFLLDSVKSPVDAIQE